MIIKYNNPEDPKLNLACGTDVDKSFVNIDIVDYGGVEIICDLFKIPWPVKSNLFKYVMISHFMEHVPHGEDGKFLFRFCEELLRICKSGAIIEIHSPHPFFSPRLDIPDHIRKISLNTFKYLINDDRIKLVRKCKIKRFNFLGISDYHFRKYMGIEIGYPKEICLIFKVV